MPAGRTLVAVVLVTTSWMSDRAATAATAMPKVTSASSAPLSKVEQEWAAIEILIAEQKLTEANLRIAVLLEAAERSGDQENWARALVRAAEARINQGGMETAVEQLRDARWPTAPLPRVQIDLIYAHALISYLNRYSWEINKRDRVETVGKAGLKQWTRLEILAAADKALDEAWELRGPLSKAPISRLSHVLIANNYPPGVRDTVRDVITYMYVDFLGNSSWWLPEQNDAVSQLDLPRLLGSTGEVLAAPPAATSPHPLARLVALLADLESWHAAAGRRDGALEAYLQRIGTLHAAFSAKGDRERIRAALGARLAAERATSWWSEGQALAATLRREVDDPGAQQEARALALLGEQAYPGTVGAANCRHLVALIEAPRYEVETMTSDGLARRSIAIRHLNLPRLFFRAYRVDPVARLAAGNQAPLPDTFEADTFLWSQTPVASWSVDLPATPDFRLHRTYVTPPIEVPGAYTVLVSTNLSFTGNRNPIVEANVILGDLVLVAETSYSRLRLRALTGNAGDSVAGVEIRLYEFDRPEPPTLVATLKTDAAGAVTYTSAKSMFAIARHGADLAMVNANLYTGYSPGNQTLFFTDRQIYRPGQTIHWKALTYRPPATGGPLELVPHHEISVTLFDPNQQQVGVANVTSNDYGTASGSFVVPAGRPLGSWMLQSKGGGGTVVQVEEYKRPTFEVTLQEPAELPRLNQPAVFRGEARYYFGTPVTAGTVRWRVRREPNYPPWWWNWQGYVGEQEVGSGTAALSEGRFEAHFLPTAVEGLEEDLSYTYRLTAEVTDEGGETRSTERSFRVGSVTVQASIESEQEFLEPSGATTMTIVRTDLDGTPREGTGRWRLLEIRASSGPRLPADEPVELPGDQAFHTPGDALRPRWQQPDPLVAGLRNLEDGTELEHGDLTHDAAGRAVARLPRLAPGLYRLRYETRDAFGAVARTQREFIVTGETALPFAEILQPQRTAAHVGDNLRVLLYSGFAGQALELAIHHGTETEYRHLVSTGNPQLLDLPIGDADRGGLVLRLVAVRDHQLLEAAATITVPWDNHELAVSYQTFRDLLRPGAKETWRVKVTEKGPRGPEPAAAEILAYMFDRSLDAYAVQQPPQPLDLFPRERPQELFSTLRSQYANWVRGGPLTDVPNGAQLHGDSLSNSVEFKPLALYRMAPGADTITVTAESPLLDERKISSGKAIPSPAQAGQPPPPPPAAITPAVRANFAETAFWQPHLLTAADGTAAIEFTVPDSVTSWNVWVHALTRDSRFGSDHREARSVKDLMARPYLPRFLREGDRAELRVVLTDTADHALDGFVNLDVLDPDTDSSLLAEFGVAPDRARQAFHLEAGKSTSVVVPLTAPRRVGQVAFKVIAAAGDASDGELRPLPLLPSRIHLTQSHFLALHDQETKSATFADLKRSDDPSRINDKLVVTLDAQLFYSVLSAVPYLVNYPYECTEQTLNRFLSTAILSSLFSRYPAVSRVAKTFAERATEEQPFNQPDANRTMALEETPWLVESQGRSWREDPTLIRVLDPQVARAERETALAKLRNSQLPSGAFPWWPGGPPSDYMTLYLLYGLAKAGEFGVEVPRDMVARGWGYLATRYTEQFAASLEKPDCDCAWEFLTFLNYLATAYPDPSWLGGALPVAERRRILDASFRHWRQQSTFLRTMLALTLHRMGRPKDAQLVMDAVMDGARTTPEEGTFWQPEDRAWLWYNDSIDSHAFALRALGEIQPQDARLAGLVQWLFLNKKLNHWKSTRSTAEVVYSLAKYLESHQELAIREAATVEVGRETTHFVFEPDQYTGAKVQVVVPGERLGPEQATVTVSKDTPGLLFASATWHFSTELLPSEERGDIFHVDRHYFRRLSKGKEVVLEPLAEGAQLAPGDELEVQLSLRSRVAAEYVHVRDPRAAGCEPGAALSGWQWDLGLPRYEEVRDSGTDFFFEILPVGEYTLRYRVHAAVAGTFRVGPATVESIYAPEFTAFSAGQSLTIQGAP